MEPIAQSSFLNSDVVFTVTPGINSMTIHNRINLSVPSACMTVIMFILAIDVTAINAQEFRWPEEPENLQVLPDDIKGAKLGSVMREFATSLGVRCDHCHVGEGAGLTKFDFESDEKVTKRKARLMLKMVAALNQQFLPELAEIGDVSSPSVEVSCMTCHRKQTRPLMLQDILASRLEADGIDAAEEEYRQLRKDYYGGFSYDFSSGALTGFGERLGNEGDFESAIRFISLEIEMNGESAGVYYTLGGIQVSAGLDLDAIESYSRGMEMAPDDWKPFFKSELDRLTNE